MPTDLFPVFFINTSFSQLIYCSPYSFANLKSSLPQLTCFFSFMHFIFTCHSKSKPFQIRRQDCHVLYQLEAPKIQWKFVDLDSLTHFKNCPSFVKGFLLFIHHSSSILILLSLSFHNFKMNYIVVHDFTVKVYSIEWKQEHSLLHNKFILLLMTPSPSEGWRSNWLQ